jgi:CBS domain-containing protein
MTVGELCNREVIICGPEDTVLRAAQTMRDRHVGSLVVVEGTAGSRVPIGILTDRDIVIYAVASGGRLGDRPVRYAMSAELVSARESDDLALALQRMRAHGIRRLPIVNDDGALQGILALDDILEFLAEELDELVRLLGREREHEIRS